MDGVTRYYVPQVTVFVDGIVTQALEVHTSHGVDSPVGQATVVLALPVPAHVEENLVVEIQATVGPSVGRIFQGVIRGPVPRDFTPEGKTHTLQCQGWGYLLALPSFEDLAYDGPLSARRVLRGIAQSRGFGDSGAGQPTFLIDEVVDLNGDPVMLGGNADVDAGQIRIRSDESPLHFSQRVAELFGYRAFDRPDGRWRVCRVSGLPDPAESYATYDETTIGFTWRRSVDLTKIITYWDVFGASGTDSDGVEFEYRSFPAVVPSHDDIPTPPGATGQQVTDELLISDELCELVRNIREIDNTDRYVLHEWELHGQPRVQPGFVVTLDAPTVGSSGDVWVMSVAHDWTVEGGFITKMTGWAGSGEALDSGSDICIDDDLTGGTAPDENNIDAAYVIHLGDETVGWYAQPAPDGLTIDLPFTPTIDSSSISLTGYAHGTNSQYIDSANEDLTVSEIEVWQDGVLIGSATLPVMDENYAQELDYGDLDNWSDFDIPITGSVVDGVAGFVRVKSGNNPDLDPSTDDDDFEIYKLVLRLCAEGTPDLPGEPTNPTIPPPQPQPPDDPCTYSSAGGTASFGVNVTIVNGPWVWPSGFRYLKVSGSATGLTGDIIGSIPVQSVYFTSAGGPHMMIVPGTQDPSDPQGTGTMQTGSGDFEVWHDLGSPPSSDIAVTGDVWLRTFNATSSPPSFTATDICFEFTNDPNP